MTLIWDKRFLFCSVLAHNRLQGCPVHSHCHVLQYANHTNADVWILVFTNANTRLASVSNTQQLSPNNKLVSVCGSVISDTAACTGVCVCSPTSSVPSHYRVCALSFTSVRCVQSPCSHPGPSLLNKYQVFAPDPLDYDRYSVRIEMYCGINHQIGNRHCRVLSHSKLNHVLWDTGTGNN